MAQQAGELAALLIELDLGAVELRPQLGDADPRPRHGQLGAGAGLESAARLVSQSLDPCVAYGVELLEQ